MLNDVGLTTNVPGPGVNVGDGWKMGMVAVAVGLVVAVGGTIRAVGVGVGNLSTIEVGDVAADELEQAAPSDDTTRSPSESTST